MDAKVPRPECREEGLGLPTGQGSLPSLKERGRGRRVSGGAGGEWEKGRKCKFLNGKRLKIKNKTKKMSTIKGIQRRKCKHISVALQIFSLYGCTAS